MLYIILRTLGIHSKSLFSFNIGHEIGRQQGYYYLQMKVT